MNFNIENRSHTIIEDLEPHEEVSFIDIDIEKFKVETTQYVQDKETSL